MMLGDLPIVIRVFVMVALVAGVGSIVLDEFRGSGSYSTAVNTTVGDGIAGIGELTSWLDLIGLIVAVGIILGTVFMSFQARQDQY